MNSMTRIPIASSKNILKMGMNFLTSSGWIGVAQQLAADYPDVNFVQNPGWNFTAGDESLTNLLGVDTKLYQAYYLAGILAGYMSKTEKIGMLNGEPGVPLTVASMNAYCVGAQSINKKIKCYSITLGSWTDPRLHHQGTRQLINMGCDHVFAVSGSVIPDTIVAEEHENGRRIFSCGFANDFRVRIGESVTSSGVIFLENTFSEAVRSHLDGDFSYGIASPGMNNGGADAAAPSSLVPLEAYPRFLSERQRLLNAGPNEEIVFCGNRALKGLPDDVQIDEDTDCMYPADVSVMSYNMGYLEEVEGEFYFNFVYLDDEHPAYIAMIVVISIVVFLSFVYLALILYYLDTAVIKVASPLFCFAILFGAWLQFAAAYLFLQEPSDAICMAPIWLEMVGLTIMLSAICVKNYRLYKLCKNSKKFFPVQVSTLELLAAMGLGVLGMIIILTAFQVVGPYEPETSRDVELEIDELYLYCATDDEGLFIGLIWGYMAFWLLSACVLAYLTRRLEGVLCESSQLALAIYNIIVLELIFLPLIYTFDRDQYEGRTILLALQPMYRGFTTISLIFLPKFWLAAVHPDKNTLTSRQTSLAHSHVSTLMDD